MEKAWVIFIKHEYQVSVLRGVVTALLAAAREGEEEVCTNNPLTLT